MGKGYLKIELFVGDNVLPVVDAKVLIKNVKGNVLYELTSDENGHTEEVSLDTVDKSYSLDPYSTTPLFAVYDVEVPYTHGYKKVIVHDVEIFDTITTILPIRMQPAIIGDTPEQNTDEIYIPLEHGVNQTRNNPMSPEPNDSYDHIEMTERAMANEVPIPDYITVHLGMPNAAANNVRVPFIDYIKVI